MLILIYLKKTLQIGVTGQGKDWEAKGLRPVRAGQESVVDLVDKSVSGDNNNTAP